MYSFVILHYKNIQETIKCLESLKKTTDIEKSNFIVVDNNSLIKEEKEKILKYTNDILMLDKNYGFAKANNKGIEYAREKYDSKFYIVINNDVFITQKNFLKSIETIYKKIEFDMLGPKIDSPSGESINPFPVIVGKDNVINEIKKCKKLIKIYKSSFLSCLLNKYIKIKKIIRKPIIKTNGSKLERDVALHGCAIIFSKKYIDKYQYPFINDTFLFHEEEFLYKRVLEDKLISIYDPSIKVFHKEGSSVKKNYKSERKSKLFREEERLKSLNLLLKQYGGRL